MSPSTTASWRTSSLTHSRSRRAPTQHRRHDPVRRHAHPVRRVHVSGNRVTGEGRLQLRRSRDGRWYLFTKATGRWAMAAPPEDDVDDLLDHDLTS